jgi:subtilase family serine protease
MLKGYSRKKIIHLFSAITLTILSMQAQAMPNSLLPSGWKAHTPIHLRSPLATLQPSGMSPAQIKQAYGFPAIYQGSGEVIAIVDAYDDPDIETDLNTFSKKFGLPACTTANGCFTKLYASGTQPQGDSGWGEEMSLDVEWAHAIAPAAKILLIEAADDGQGLYDAVQVAIQQKASVISLSWGGDEFSSETSLDSIFKASTVPIVVSSGDSGAGVSYPAASPYVVAAGGTALTLDGSGNYLSETAWDGSGGGVSAYETEPSYQTTFPLPDDTSKGRGVPDVAYNASPNTGYSIYDSYGQGGWLVVGGTSASAPQWAALIAVMKSAKKGNFGNFDTSIYSVVKKSSTLTHDVTSGTNGTCGYYCTARSGYDYVTGLGTPQADNLIKRFMLLKS